MERGGREGAGRPAHSGTGSVVPLPIPLDRGRDEHGQRRRSPCSFMKQRMQGDGGKAAVEFGGSGRGDGAPVDLGGDEVLLLFLALHGKTQRGTWRSGTPVWGFSRGWSCSREAQGGEAEEAAGSWRSADGSPATSCRWWRRVVEEADELAPR